MDNNYETNTNMDSWEFSLEAILAEYSAEPEPVSPRTPEETRSREIVMEALSDRISAAVTDCSDFPEAAAKKKPLRPGKRTQTPPRAPVTETPPEPEECPAPEESECAAPAEMPEPEAVQEVSETPEVPAAPEPEAEPEADYDLADIIAETKAAQEDSVCAVEISGDEDSAYAAAADYPDYDASDYDEDAEDRHAHLRPEKKRPSILVALMAALLIRRQQRAAAQPQANVKAQSETESAEVSLKAASKYYLKSAGPFKLRFLAAACLSLILLYIAWGLPLLGAMQNVRVCAGMCLVLELSVMLLGLDVFTAGMTTLLRGKPGLESLVAVSCIFSALDAVLICVGGKYSGTPYCAVSAIAMTLALLGSRYRALGYARSFHTAASSATPFVVTAEGGAIPDGNVLIKSEQDARGFVNRSQRADLVENAYTVAAPILLIAAPVLAFLATVVRKQAGDFFHCLSALTAVSTSFSALLCFTLPFHIVSKRLASVGAAIAGWAGCADIGESRRTVVTDEDIFPTGHVLIDTIRILEGVYTDKVISYAGSVIAFSGCGLVSAFTDLMRRNGCAMQQVESFACHKGGGLTAIVRGEQVFVGNSSFMNLMGIRLPQSQMSKTSVFVAISGELVGVFSIRYTPTAAIQEALVSLLHSRSGAPLFAIRDFNVTPLLIKQRFRMPTEGFEFPIFPERYRISAITAGKNSAPAALLVRKGLAPYAEAVQAGRGLYKGSRLCLLLSLLCSVLGMLLMFFLCATGSYDSASVGNMLIFMLLWLAPVVIVSLSLRR